MRCLAHIQPDGLCPGATQLRGWYPGSLFSLCMKIILLERALILLVLSIYIHKERGLIYWEEIIKLGGHEKSGYAFRWKTCVCWFLSGPKFTYPFSTFSYLFIPTCYT